MTKLTPKQQRFVDEYLIDGNGTRAAVAAGYSKRTAKTTASENLTKPNVATELERRQAELQKITGLTQERVYRELERLCFLDPADFYDQIGNLLPIQDLPEDARRCLTGYETLRRVIGRDGEAEAIEIKKIKFVDKKGALELAAKLLGMTTEKKDLASKGESIYCMSTEELMRIARGGKQATTSPERLNKFGQAERM